MAHPEDDAGDNVPPPAVAFIVATCVVVAGPLHPAALAVITEVPFQPAA